MMKKVAKQNFPSFIKAVAQNYTVLGPVVEDGNVLFKDVSQSGEVQFDYLNSKTNPKQIFFPQSEVLFNFNQDQLIPTDPTPQRKLIVFGIRPCDVKGLCVIDKVYLAGDYKDVYYQARRERGLIISLACNNPGETCFCASVGGGPAQEDGSDIMAYDCGESIVLKPITPKGENFIKDYEQILQDAATSDLERVEKQIKDRAANSKLDLQTVKESLARNFNHEYWADVHQKCLGCGICTYICPTCHCFDITDQDRGTEGERLRSWDSCMFRLFTLETSGHNPRPSGQERVRQRVMHKFKYLPDNCQVLGCTGCGRCVRECPVNLDIREVLKELAEL